MMLIKGCVFATENLQFVGEAIHAVEEATSQDQDAKYGHTGIIQDDKGTTFEAVWTITEQNLFDTYKGKDVLIAKWKYMDPVLFEKGMKAVSVYKGRVYPFQRLIWHLLGLARWIHLFKTPVCSELTALYLVTAGANLYCGHHYFGVTPDNLVDDWRINKEFEIIFEGKL